LPPIEADFEAGLAVGVEVTSEGFFVIVFGVFFAGFLAAALGVLLTGEISCSGEGAAQA